jgi:hypothetical protein
MIKTKKETKSLPTGYIGDQQAMGKKFSTNLPSKKRGVELLMQVEHHKEAIDWARLSTSKIAKELNNENMKAASVYKRITCHGQNSNPARLETPHVRQQDQEIQHTRDQNAT